MPGNFRLVDIGKSATTVSSHRELRGLFHVVQYRFRTFRKQVTTDRSGDPIRSLPQRQFRNFVCNASGFTHRAFRIEENTRIVTFNTGDGLEPRTINPHTGIDLSMLRLAFPRNSDSQRLAILYNTNQFAVRTDDIDRRYPYSLAARFIFAGFRGALESFADFPRLRDIARFLLDPTHFAHKPCSRAEHFRA